MNPYKKFVEVDQWKEYFDNMGKDVFEVMEFAIKVASRYRPAGLLENRFRLAQQLFLGFNDDGEITSEDNSKDELMDDIFQVAKQTENIVANKNDNEEYQEKPRHVIRIKLKKGKEDVSLSSYKQEEMHINVEDAPNTITELPFQGVRADMDKSMTVEQNVEESKVIMEDRYTEFKNAMKRARMLDCGKIIRKRPLVSYRIRRTMA